MTEWEEEINQTESDLLEEDDGRAFFENVRRLTKIAGRLGEIIAEEEAPDMHSEEFRKLWAEYLWFFTEGVR